MKAIFVESSLPNVSKNFVLKNIGILSDKYMSLIRETLKYCLADLFRKWGGVPLWRTKSAKQYLKASLTHFPILSVLAFSLSQMAHISSQANGFGPNPRWCIQRKVNTLENTTIKVWEHALPWMGFRVSTFQTDPGDFLVKMRG